jgi:hypothetical protein
MADQGILQSESVFVKIGGSEICLGLGSQRQFGQILQKLFAFFYNLKNFTQISEEFFRGEINFLRSQNFTV